MQEFAAQYAAAILTAAIVATVFFPGNAFLPGPWYSDDYRNLVKHLDYHPGHRIDFFCSRPVSDNLIGYLSAAGESAYFLAMFLLTALLPVLAVRLALRLFRCRPGPWLTLWLIAAGVVLHLPLRGIPLVLSLHGLDDEPDLGDNRPLGRPLAIAASSTARNLPPPSSLLFLSTAFAKEDLLLFVPLFVTADWCILRLKDKNLAGLRSLALVYGALAVVGAALYCWNKWIVPSPFTSNVGEAFQARSDALPHLRACVVLCDQFAYAARDLDRSGNRRRLGIARRGHRVAALGSLLLPLSLVLPYAILVKFQSSTP